MEELGTMWAHAESGDEMKSRLLWTAMELESVKMEASEEMKKYKHNIRNLLELLKTAYRERDEAREQIYWLLEKLSPPISAFKELEPGPSHPLVSPELDNYLATATTIKAISSLTESNGSHSPLESFVVDAVTSPPDSSSFTFVNQQRFNGAGSIVGRRRVDTFSGIDILDDLARGKVLPQKGKLLQAVTEAGPLLQTLLVAGPLPQWRNPPPLQPINAPLLPPHVVSTIKGFDSDAGSSGHQQHVPSPAGCGIVTAHKPVSLDLHRHDNVGRANPQMCSASLLNVMGSRGFPSNCLHPLSSGPGGQFHMAKRQRFH
ncbi:hypothetical protein SAY87_005291 [Trapa incisa]|uniref:Uncharacterized protein n=1 Tax=Trapa incisa TaxID=236973 RepID=A0AAN7Q6T0_9MYRT|nr:hypothetical protein SAY87_005291 [Trapa incisa]